jgi:hypothetical protein
MSTDRKAGTLTDKVVDSSEHTPETGREYPIASPEDIKEINRLLKEGQEFADEVGRMLEPVLMIPPEMYNIRLRQHYFQSL